VIAEAQADTYYRLDGNLLPAANAVGELTPERVRQIALLKFDEDQNFFVALGRVFKPHRDDAVPVEPFAHGAQGVCEDGSADPYFDTPSTA